MRGPVRISDPTPREAREFVQWLSALVSGFLWVGSHVEPHADHIRRYRAFMDAL